MESSDGIELLLDAGLERRVAGSSEVEIRAGEGEWSRRRVLLLRHSPSPREISKALAAARAGDGVLFVVARAGRALEHAAARDARVAYAAVDEAVVCFRSHVYRAADDRRLGAERSGRVSWTRFALLRLFAISSAAPVSQTAIARRLGVSRVAVGKQLPLLDGLVERGRSGWNVVDRRRCWDAFMSDYPGPRGLATYWSAADDLAAQLSRTAQVVSSVVVSGDFAADFYAPWRRPSRVVVYVGEQPALEEHRFATVRATDATMELRTPADPTVLAMSRDGAPPGGRGIRTYVDPLIAAWDLHRSPGGDVDSAVEQLRTRTLREELWS